MRTKVILVCFFVIMGWGNLWAQTEGSADLPTVRVIGTGGTIVHLPARGDLPDEFVSPEDVLGTILPQVKQVADVKVEDLMRKPSQDFTVSDYLTIAKRINEIFSQESEVDGIVVTEGSNAVEETSYFLNLTVKSSKPVVVTAANRLFSTLSSDSPMNLLDAIQVAAAPQSRGKGVMVVLNGSINAARGVTKVSSYMGNYRSRDLGFLGYVGGDNVAFYRTSLRKHTTRSMFDISQLQSLPKVYVIYAYVDSDDLFIRAAVGEGQAQGLVVASFPTGVDTPAMQQALEKVARQGVIVVRTNRGGQGRLAPSSRFPLFVTGDTLSPQQARILLMLALTKTQDRQEIQKIFSEY